MLLRTFTATFALLALALTTPIEAVAYTDPGSGVLLYQMLYAGFLAGTFYLRRFLDRFVGRRK